MTALVLIVTLLAVIVFAAAGLVAAVTGRRDRAVRRATVALALAASYAAVLITVALVSAPRTLAAGEWKCFDDWCVTAGPEPGAGPGADGCAVRLQVRSAARRVAQRPDSPQLSVQTPAGGTPVPVPGLDQRLQPGQSATLRLVPPSAVAGGDARILITEGGFPSVLVIGDENSPWHAKASWRLDQVRRVGCG